MQELFKAMRFVASSASTKNCGYDRFKRLIGLKPSTSSRAAFSQWCCVVGTCSHLCVDSRSMWEKAIWSRQWNAGVLRKVQQEFPELRKRQWGRHFWGRGYFSMTSGNVMDEMIEQQSRGCTPEQRRGQHLFRVIATYSQILKPTDFQSVVVEFFWPIKL